MKCYTSVRGHDKCHVQGYELGSQDTISKHNTRLSSIVIAAVCSKESCMNN